MSDKQLVDSIAVPQASTSLDGLATLIRAEHQAVGFAAKNMLEHALRAGEALLAAKEQLDYGKWLPWLRSACDLSERHAQRYMAIFAAREELKANATRVSDLSLRAALEQISSKRIRAVPKLGNTGNQNQQHQQSGPTEFDALGWWTTASLEQRRHLLDGIGHTPILEALPPAWRNEFEQRIANHLTAEQLLELLERKIEHTPKTRAAFKGIRKALRHPQLELEATPSVPRPHRAVDVPTARDDVFRCYTRLSLEDLDNRILTIQRMAGSGSHLSPEQWRAVDRMRARAVELKRDLATSAQGQERTMTATA